MYFYTLLGHFEVDRETTKKEDDRIDCDCQDDCTTNTPSDLTSASCHYSPNAVLMVLALALILSLIDLC